MSDARHSQTRRRGRCPVRDLQIERLESRVVFSLLPAAESAVADAPPAVAIEEIYVADSVGPGAVIAAETAELVAAPCVPEPGSVADSAVPILGMDPALSLVDWAPGSPVAGGASPSGSPGGPPGGGNTPKDPDRPLMPPVITEFDGEYDAGVWAFSGMVLDDKAVIGLTIHFGGLLAGHTTTVDANGFFEYLVILPRNAVGSVNAYTIDRDGLRSELVSFWVHM